jgi:LacI family transcriptional regulator
MTPVHVGLALDYDLHYCRCVLRGIKDYAVAKPGWVFLSAVADPKAVKALCGRPLDGLIAQVWSRPLAEVVAALKRPLVNVSRALFDLPFPRVGVEEGQVGAVVARHFLERGLRHFAFVGCPNYHYSVEREAGARQALASAGYPLRSYQVSTRMLLAYRTRPWTQDGKLLRWVRALPKPVGLFASNDLCGAQLSEVCHEAGLHMPEQVALVGVDNDDLFCELARPSLSSVAIPAERIGYEAAALLDRLLAGARPPRRPLLLPPVRLVARQSSDVVALDDAEVAAALRVIRAHAHVPLGVADVLREVPVSRRALERRFRHALHRGLGDEIRRVHVERAKELLASTELPVAGVAERSGFSSSSHLCVVFRQETGLTPTAFRRQVRS